MTECYNCGSDGATNSLMVNNSKMYDSPTSHTTELDVPFDVDFGDGPDELGVVTVVMCDSCHKM